MPSLNRVMLMGNLTRDPELRYTPKGMAVTDIALAINRRYKVENETREEVTFVDITYWGRQAELVCQYLKKGNPLYVEGRLQMDTWDDKQTGQKRSRMKVIGEALEFIGGGGQRSNQGGGGGGPDDYVDEGPPQGQSRGYSQQRPQGGGGGGGYNSGGGGGGGYSSAPQQRQSPPPAQSNAFPPGLDDEDEIPF